MRKMVSATIACVAFSFFGAYAQSTPQTEDVIKAQFLFPGLSYEKSIGPRFTVYTGGWVGFNTEVTEDFGSSDIDIKFYAEPGATVNLRYYYNFENREARGKRTELNNLNYLAPVYQFAYSRTSLKPDKYDNETSARPVHLFGIVWGFQRNYPRRFSLDLNLGVGYATANTTVYEWVNNNQVETKSMVGGLTLINQFTLGIWLNARNN